MGERNAVINEYLSDNERFADLVNVGIFAGEQVVRAEELSDMDTKVRRREVGRGGGGHHEYARDQLKQWRCGGKRLVIGVEPEDSVHYALPVKYMKYDSIQYQGEYRERAKAHRREKDLSRKEYISGYNFSESQ